MPLTFGRWMWIPFLVDFVKMFALLQIFLGRTFSNLKWCWYHYSIAFIKLQAFLNNFTKNIKVIFISLTLLYIVFQFGYIDIIIKYMNLTYSSSYLIDIISSIIIRSVFIGGILNFCKIKLNDINICVIIHILINILIFCK